MIGAHAAILGVAAFEGNVRSILINLDQLANRTGRMAASQQRDFDAAAKATESSMARQAAAAEATSKAVSAAADFQAARARAAVDQQLADQARLTAGLQQASAMQQAVLTANARSAAKGAPAGSPAAVASGVAQSQLAGANISAGAAAANAAALEKQAIASEKAAASAENLAQKAIAGANAASAAVGGTTTAVAELGTGFTATAALGTAAMFAIIAAVTLGIAAIIGFGVASIKAGADYSQAMNTTQALTDATNSKMAELDVSIRNIGTHTLSSMGDAAKAATELAKGGIDVDTAMQGALKSVVNLAAASVGELSLAEAAKAVANGVAAFNLQGAESVRVADSLAGVAQSTTASFGDLAHSLSQVGTVGNSLGFSIEATTDAIGLLALSAIKGSDAGTSLRAMFQQLEKPTKQARQVMNDYNVSLYDAAGNARPLRDIIGNLETAFGKQALAAGKLTQEQRDLALATLFGRDGQRAALALINQGVEGYDKLAAAQRNLTAEDLAGRMLVPLNAQLAILGNNVNAAQVAIGQSFEPVLQGIVGASIAWLQTLNEDTSALTLLGNTLTALSSGNGLEGLYTQIVNVFGPNTGSMIIEIVNLFRNVGDAISTYIAPALANLGEQIQRAFPTADLDTFAGLMSNAAVVTNILAAAIGGLINAGAGLLNYLHWVQL
jgi:TP901 family phage tail tape measure protein